jgi:hypothetical protein
MKHLLRLVAVLAGIVLALAVMVTGALFILDDDDYRSALVWVTGSVLDASLEIRGPFALHFGREASLTSGDILLRANDGSYSLAVGELQADIRLDALLEGIVWVKSLALADVRLEAKQAPGADEPGFPGFSIPVFVIEQARLDSVNLVYQEADPGKIHRIDLHSLVVDEINNNGPLGIQGNGTFQKRQFSIKGRLDSLAQLTASEAPYAVQLDITSGTLKTHLEGMIAKPLEGTGLDLQLDLNDTQLSRTLRLWNERAPELGIVTARMQLRGDYDKPRLEHISVHLQRPGELDLKVSGEVADLPALDGVELRLDGRSSNPAVLSWLLFDHRNRLQSLTGIGTIRISGGRYRIEDLQATAKTRGGVQLEVSGTADICRALGNPPSRPVGFQLTLAAPTTRALTLLAGEGDAIREFGRLNASARMMVCRDGISLDDLKLDIGGSGQVRATAQGSVETIPFSAVEKSSGFNLTLDMRAEKTSYLDRYLKLKLPELGAVQARTRVRGGMSSVSLETLELTVGSPDQPLLRANGTVRTGFRQRTTTMDIGVDIATAGLLAALYKRPSSADLGRLDGNLTASDTDGSWGVDKLTLMSTRTSLFQLKATGGLDDLVKRDQGRVRTTLEISDVPALGRALGVDLSGFSSYRGQGHLEINKGRLVYQASNTLGKTSSTTRLTGSLAGARPRLQGTLVIPVFDLADFGIGTHADGAKETGAARKGAGSQFLFSKQAFNLGILQTFDLDLTVTVSSVAGTGLRFEELDARINLQDGVLRAAPVKLQFEGGPATVDLVINTRQKPAFNLRVSGDDLSLGPALAQIQNEVPVEGYVNLQVDVSADGNSAHALASTVTGKFGFGLENARVPRKYVEYLAVDVFGWAFNTATRRDPYANLDCVMAAFDIKDGVATSSLLAADGPTLTLAGTATLDFGKETMDLTLLPKQKATLFSNLAPVHIKGAMRDPDVEALPVKSAVTSLGSLALVPALPMVAIPAILGEKLWATIKNTNRPEGGCTELAEKIQKRKEKKPDKWFW